MPTLRRKEGTEKLDLIICAHAVAEGRHRREFVDVTAPYVTSHAPNS
jgi:hypothetical protein